MSSWHVRQGDHGVGAVLAQAEKIVQMIRDDGSQQPVREVDGLLVTAKQDFFAANQNVKTPPDGSIPPAHSASTV
jgi:hypothetical protein